MGSEEAFVTLATNDSYGLGALVLAHSLRNTGTTKKIAILITPEVSNSMRSQLSKVYDVVEVVDVMDSKDAANLTLLARPELGITLTKLHAWNLTQFKKAVFLDADCLIIRNVDELFERDELSAVPDVGWPDCFNTGVFVFQPNATTYANLVKFALEKGSFDGGDQGLLNSYFSDWSHKDIKNHLSFIYNMVATAIYSYAPAFKQYGGQVKIVHFLGSTKPWHQTSASSGAFSPALGNYLQLWWNVFNQQVRGGLEPGLVGLAGQIGQLNLGSSYGQHISHPGASTASHRRDWESGNIDYMGADRFENIQRRIQDSIQKSSTQSAQRSSPPPPQAEAHTLVERAKDAAEPVVAAASSAAHVVSDATKSVAATASGAAHAMSDATKSAASAIGSGLVKAVEGAAHLASSAYEAVGEVIHPHAAEPEPVVVPSHSTHQVAHQSSPSQQQQHSAQGPAHHPQQQQGGQPQGGRQPSPPQQQLSSQSQVHQQQSAQPHPQQHQHQTFHQQTTVHHHEMQPVAGPQHSQIRPPTGQPLPQTQPGVPSSVPPATGPMPSHPPLNPAHPQQQPPKK